MASGSRYLVVCACEFDAAAFAREYGAGECRVVAVDAGYAELARLGVAPDAVLGDFDSLGYVTEVPGAEALTFPAEKDASDFELALAYARERGAAEVVAFGVLGGRLDQTLAVLQTAAGYADAFEALRLVGRRETVHVLGPGQE